MSIFPTQPQGAGWKEGLGAVSPLLLAMGADLSAGRPMGTSTGQGLAAMMAMQEQKQAQAQRERLAAAVRQATQGGGAPTAAGVPGPGAIPQGLAGVLGAMDPEQAAGVLAQVMTQRPEAADPWGAYKVAGGAIFGLGPDGRPQMVAQAPASADKPGVYRVGDQLVDETGRVIYSAPERGGASPQTQLAKLRADLDAGFISPEQYDAAVRKATTESGGITVSPDGTVQIGGGGLPKAPSGFTYVEGDGGMELRPIAGGPGEQIGAEVAGRIALAEDSLKQLPGLIEMARRGELTGPIDQLTGRMGWGEQGRARRENLAGSEAITRMLTGAGMNQAEAERESELYVVGALDDDQSAVSKLTQLQRRLTGLVETSTRGRRQGVPLSPTTGGGVSPEAPAAGAAPVAVPQQIREQAQPGDVIEGPGGVRYFFNGVDFQPIDG